MKYYKYHEEKNGKEVRFGWIVSDNILGEVVLSLDELDETATPQEASWSKNEGSNVALLSDYHKYFKALLSQTPHDFLSQWNNDYDGFKKFWENLDNKLDKSIMTADFIFKLSKLLVKKESFLLKCRKYQVVKL